MTEKTAKNVTRQRAGQNKQPPRDLGERQHCIAEAAYYKAEKRGFEPGKEYDDWLEAEQEFDARQAGN